MAYTVRTDALSLDFAGKRSVGVLSTGAAVLLVPENSSGTRRWYLYYSTDRQNWTLKNTITPTTQIVASGWYSMVVDGSDNIHLAWKDTSGNIKYKLLTFGAGPTWTVGADETVGAVGGKVFKWIDLDVVTGTVACVMTVNTTDTTVRSWVRRSSDNTWVQLTDQALTATLPTTGSSITCARDAGGLVGGNGVMAYIVRNKDTLGDQIRIKTFNPTTGAQVSDTLMAGGIYPNQPMKDYMIFSKASNEWVAVALIGQTNCFVTRARFTATGYMNGWSGGPTGLTVVRGSGDTSVAFGCVGDACTVIFKMGSEWVNVPVVFDSVTGVAKWGVWGYWQETDGANATRIFSGNNRNLSARKIDTFDYNPTSGVVKSWYNQTPIAPTLVDPGNGTTVTTDVPTLTGRMKNATARPQAKMRGKWQVARDAGFSINLQTITDPVTEFAKVGTTQVTTSEYSPELFQGTWYARFYQQTEFGVDSPASSVATFTIAHPPVNIPISPSGDQYYDYGASGQLLYSWRFTDPSAKDFETAHQIVVELNDGSGTIVLDSGKVADATPYITQGNEDSDYANLAAGYKDVALRWYVKTWDSDDVSGNFSDALPFRIGDSPILSITSPATDGATVTVPSPTVTWSFTSGGGGRTQKSRRVVFYQGSTVIHDSGWADDSGTSYTPPGAIVTNGNTYLVGVAVRDTGGLEKVVWRTFVVSYTPPAAPTYTLDPSLYSSQGYLQITWNNAARDAAFNSWRIYRRRQGTSDWTLVTEYTDDLTSYNYQDWFLPSNNIYEYTVVQTAVVFGVIVESAYNTTTVSTTSEDYWLLHPTDSSLNVRLSIVTADSFSEEYESATLNVIGRGRKKDYGTRWGYTGSLTALLRDNTSVNAPRTQRQKVEALKALKGYVYLRNPFGDVWMVSMDDVQVQRVPGSGYFEYTDLTIPYEEVSV